MDIAQKPNKSGQVLDQRWKIFFGIFTKLIPRRILLYCKNFGVDSNHFLENTGEIPEMITSTGAKFWLRFCLSVLVLVIFKSPITVGACFSLTIF